MTDRITFDFFKARCHEGVDAALAMGDEEYHSTPGVESTVHDSMIKLYKQCKTRTGLLVHKGLEEALEEQWPPHGRQNFFCMLRRITMQYMDMAHERNEQAMEDAVQAIHACTEESGETFKQKHGKYMLTTSPFIDLSPT